MLLSPKIHLLFVCLCAAAVCINSQAQIKNDLKTGNSSKNFSFTLFGMYVSSSELQNEPHSSDPIEQNALVGMSGGYGYGAELQYKPNFRSVDLIFFLSAEYVKINETALAFGLGPDTSEISVSMVENFYVVPVEFGVKWDLPVSTDAFKIYIGGGGGFYFGNRTRTLGGSLVSNTDFTKPGFSVNILSGLEYYLEKNVSANFELKFREGFFDVQSRFNQSSITVGGIAYDLQNPFYSRIILDGVRVSLGLKYSF